MSAPVRGMRRTQRAADDEPFELHNELLDAILRQLKAITWAVWILAGIGLLGFAFGVLLALANYTPPTTP